MRILRWSKGPRRWVDVRLTLHEHELLASALADEEMLRVEEEEAQEAMRVYDIVPDESGVPPELTVLMPAVVDEQVAGHIFVVKLKYVPDQERGERADGRGE